MDTLLKLKCKNTIKEGNLCIWCQNDCTEFRIQYKKFHLNIRLGQEMLSGSHVYESSVTYKTICLPSIKYQTVSNLSVII